MADQKFYELEYTHEQLKNLLDRIKNGHVLSEKEYKFLTELMGSSNNEEEEVSPIDPNDFITKDEIKDYVDNSLKQIGAATKEDLNSLQDDMSTLHNQDVETLRIEIANKIAEAIENEMEDLTDYVGNALEQVEDALGQLESNLDRIEDALEQVEDVIKPEPGEVPDYVLDKIEELEQTTTNLEKEISDLREDMNANGGNSNVDTSALESRIVDLENAVGTLETNYADLKEVVDNFEFDPSVIDPVAIDERFKKLEGMLDAPASYVKPTVSISATPQTIESGIATTITIVPKFVQNDAGAMISCVVEGMPSGIREDLDSFTEDIILAHDATITCKVTVNYGEGPTKETQMGNVDTNNIKAGSISSSVSVKAYAASYSGAISNDSVSGSDVSSFDKTIRTSKGSTVTYNLNNQRSVYMYPSSFGSLSSIKDANGFDYIDSYTRSMMTYNNVSYYVYVMNEPTTITNFKQTFN